MSWQSALPRQLYRAEQVRALDHCAIHEFGVPGFDLMQRAGTFAFKQLCLFWPAARRISVWCGAGNNGGDAYVVAGLARQHGFAVQLVQVGHQSRLGGDALRACQWARERGVEFTPFSAQCRVEGDVVVDGLLGTGLDSEVRPPFAEAIACINSCGQPVLALDIPSGLSADTGAVLGNAVRAELTTTFIALKRGMLTGRGPACCGEIRFSDLEVPAGVYEREVAETRRLDEADLAAFRPRRRDAHKGEFGHVLIVGGNLGMGGAVMMAAQAAGRVGAGLVSVATRPEHVPALLTRTPEVMAHGIASAAELAPLLAGKQALVVGPGLGQDDWALQLLALLMKTEVPLVVDADALNLISAGAVEKQPQTRWLLTPHPGEAARLLARRVTDIQADRFAALRALQQRYGGVVLLKGAGTLLAGEGGISLCSAGNPGMAAGGMGDVLSGVLGGLLAQGFEMARAAQLGAVLHACAADRAAQDGERGMQATDLMPCLRQLVNGL